MKSNRLVFLALALVITACATGSFQSKRHALLNRIDLNPRAEMSLDESILAFSSTEDIYNRNLIERNLCVKGGGIPSIKALDTHMQCDQYAPADKGVACVSDEGCQGICLPGANVCSSNWAQVTNCADFLESDGNTSSVCFGDNGIGG